MDRNNAYLKFYQTVLERVFFDRQLFWKEYQKALKYLSQQERVQLDDWIQSKFLRT